MRILGLDLGSSSVKAVEVESAFGRFEVKEYYESPVDPGASVVEVAVRLIQGLPKAPDRIVTALRTQKTTFRNLTIPSKDKKAIQSGVQFELEDELPFDLDKAAYDSCVLSQAQQSTQVHVAATLQKHLTAFLAEGFPVGLDPDCVTTEAWALRGLIQRLHEGSETSDPVLIVQVGHERTLIYAQHKEMPIVARELPIGGRDLTLAICQKYGISMDQAETAKRDNGFLLPQSQRNQATSEQNEFSDTLMLSFVDLIREIRQTLLTVKNISKMGVKNIYLTGGTSLLPGFAKVLEEDLQVTALPLRALSGVGKSSGVTYSEQTEAAFGLATGLALTLVGPSKNTQINFRQKLFAKESKSSQLNWAALRGPLQGVAAVLFCMILSLNIQRSVYQTRIKKVDIDLERAVKSFFGGSIAPSAVRSYLADTKRLKTAIQTEISKQRETSKLMGPNPKNPLAFLKEISNAISKDVVIDTVRFQAGSSTESPYSTGSGSEEATAQFTVVTTNPQTLDRLTSLLGKKMTQVEKSKVEEVPTDAGHPEKRWKAVFSGKLTESSYGP